MNTRIHSVFVAGVAALVFTVAPALSDEDDIEPHAEAVTKLVIERDIEISYDYVETLMRLPNAFGEGAACVICHGDNDPKKSYRGLDLTSCGGIIRGATEPPARPIVIPGKSRESRIWRVLHDNRMPYGVAFDYPRDAPNILAVKKWIDDGANNDDHFNKNILPLFEQKNAFGIDSSCVFCHFSNDRDSERELDLTSHDGLMLGANFVSLSRRGLPPRPIIIPGDSDASNLYQRLVENRMPAGIDPGESKDHPNMLLMMRWIDQGANCR
ncbi:MAG: hypothetical protein ACTSV1_00975 [Alphaproteobacteria bacterium]